MTVLVLLLAMLLGIFNATTSNWQRGEARTDTFREARAALALISRDLGQTIAPPTGTPALVLDRHPDDGPASAEDPNEQAHCLTLAPNTGKSALCAVSYFCRWDSTRTTWTLARRLVNSDNLFIHFGQAKTASPTDVFKLLFARVNDLDQPAPANADDDIAAFVWDLQFRIPSNLNAAEGAAQAPAVPTPGKGQYGTQSPFADRLPPYVEVRFKALSAGAARRMRGIATKSAWFDPNNPLYRTVILPGSQQFVQRVPLSNAPLPP